MPITKSMRLWSDINQYTPLSDRDYCINGGHCDADDWRYCVHYPSWGPTVRYLPGILIALVLMLKLPQQIWWILSPHPGINLYSWHTRHSCECPTDYFFLDTLFPCWLFVINLVVTMQERGLGFKITFNRSACQKDQPPISPSIPHGSCMRYMNILKLSIWRLIVHWRLYNAIILFG